MFGDHTALEHTEPDEEFLEESGRAFTTLVDAMERVMDSAESSRNSLDAALMVWSQIHGAVLLWNTGMFPPPLAGSAERGEADFRRITFEALRNTVDAIARAE
jgi:hypothetical protein